MPFQADERYLPPRRVFAWEHAIGSGLATIVIVVISFTIAPAVEPSLRDFMKRQPLPGYTEVVFAFCNFVRSIGWMLVWAPAITMGFLFGMMGSRGRRRLLVLSAWSGLGIVLSLFVAISLYAPLLSAAFDFASGGK